MIPEFGHFALVLALCLALIQGVVPLLGAQRGIAGCTSLAKSSAQAVFLAMSLSFATLCWCFYANDFSVAYVAEHSNAQLPLMYRIGAVWGGHEGSLLLWAYMLTLWTLLVVQFSGSLDETTLARVVGVLGLVLSGLLLFVLFTSNPFDRLIPAPGNGRDLNPLLQDPGLVFHPPMLYMGYVGFSVAFAFAIAALLEGRLDATWARYSRPWTIAAWSFLTLGIALGSWWAYYELGWGGWWFWDPVENASFMPWLIGTALLHSLAVTEKRGSFKGWTVLLAICAFSLSLLGTFLVRSGVLTSVHAFATDPRRGVFILILLALVVGASLFLFALRAGQIRNSGVFALASRETFLLIGNVFLVVAASAVLLGTVYPLVMDALNLGKLSVGPPYFNTVFVPIMVPVLLLLAVGPLAQWKQTRLGQIASRMKWVALVSVLSPLVCYLVMGNGSAMTFFGVFLAVWVGASVAAQLFQRLRAGNPPLSYWGMQAAHLGMAVFVFGVTMVSGYQQERDVRMEPGDVTVAGGYEFKFLGANTVAGPNYEAAQGAFEVRHGDSVTTMRPEKRRYFSSSMPTTEAAIDASLFRDLYVSLNEPLDGQAWAVRVYHKPFVDWIWGGCLLMAFGALLSALDRRYRKPRT